MELVVICAMTIFTLIRRRLRFCYSSTHTTLLFLLTQVCAES